jgi:hypothetical protein
MPQTERAFFALTPTATPPGYTNPYDVPINEVTFYGLVPSDVQEKCSPSNVASPMIAIYSVSALTATSTEFDDGPVSTLVQPTANPSPSAEISPEAEANGSRPPPSATFANNGPPSPTRATDNSPLQATPPSQAPPPQMASPFQPLPPSKAPPIQGSPSSPPLPPSPVPAGSQSQNGSPVSPPDIVIGTQILAPGSSAITVSGVPIFIGSDYAPAPSSASNLGSFIEFGLGGTQTPTPALSPVATQAPPIVVDSQTLTPGAPAVTVSGTPVSLALIPTVIVIGTNTIPVSQAPTPPSSPAGTPATLIVVDNQPLTPGAPAVTVSGTPVSLASIPTAIVVGTSTIPINQASPLTAIVIGTNTIPVSQASNPTSVVTPGSFVIGSQTLTPGGPAVVTLSDGQTLSFAQSSTALVVGTQTILPGAPGVTISGTEYSLAPNATAFVVNGETVGSVVPVGTRTASGSSPAVYTGTASRTTSVPTDWWRMMAFLLWGGLLATSCAASN